MCLLVMSPIAGAYLPRVRAPPAPAALWHMAQLTRNSSPPLAASPLVGSTASSEGTAGPGASDSMYAPSDSICASVNWGSPPGAWTIGPESGMRPVPTWKSTDAAPTPARAGPAILSPLPVARPSAFCPWHEAQLARKSCLPSSMDWAGSALVVASASLGAMAAYTAPVRNRPSISRMAIAAGCRRRAASEFTVRSCRLVRVRWSDRVRLTSLQDVDHDEQGDPHDVDEVPVVGRDDRAGGLRVRVAAGGEGAPDDEQERDETAGDVHAVEAGGQVEDRAVRVGGEGDALADEVGVLVDLARDEDGAEDVGEDVPLAHAPRGDLGGGGAGRAGDDALLGLQGAELAPHRRHDQDDGVAQGEGHVEHHRALFPELGLVAADREVEREQRREEHQLAGQPHHGADGHHVGTRRRPLPRDRGDRPRRPGLRCSLSRHARHYGRNWRRALR